MLKIITFTSLILFSTQNAIAFGLDDVNNVNAATDSAQQVSDKADSIKEKSVSDMATQVASDSATGAVDGAVSGAATGSIVESGTDGAIDGAKTSLNKL